ncbi:hypothetical protein GCM10011375_18210 [Hymenobacter qilianensis]|uniref:Uncharacterized protein n=1 Tax=Hymenobacter qilianensis TaxID=1385715 RepID=A0ACB5PR15_9BACT|nr:hypothetical protein GCM10011375_18210 [Hymenobacter qilianensis]
MMVMMVAFVGLAEKVYEGADNVNARPAQIQPVKAFWHLLGGKKVKYQVGANAHDQAGDGNELVAVEGAGAIEFGKIHGE